MVLDGQDGVKLQAKSYSRKLARGGWNEEQEEGKEQEDENNEIMMSHHGLE